MTTLVHIQRYSRYVRKADGTKRRCLHCTKWATVKATRRSNGKRMPVCYCDDCYATACEVYG